MTYTSSSFTIKLNNSKNGTQETNSTEPNLIGWSPRILGMAGQFLNKHGRTTEKNKIILDLVALKVL